MQGIKKDALFSKESVTMGTEENMKKLYKLFTLLVLFTATLSAQNFTREIKVAKPRMNGTDVLQLQRTLLTLGFEEVGEADGYFGPMSAKALKKYQGIAGFEQTGVYSKGNSDFLYGNSFLNLQFNLAIQKFNLVTSCRSYESYMVVLDEDTYKSSEGAAMDIYKDGDKTVYAFTSICGELGRFGAYFIPLGSGDYLYIEESVHYDSPFGSIASQDYKTYLCANGKLYKVTAGTFAPATEAQLGYKLRDLKNAVKN